MSMCLAWPSDRTWVWRGLSLMFYASGFFQLRHLYHIWWLLDFESTATLVHAFMSSRMDYCNSLFWCTKYHNRQVTSGLKRCHVSSVVARNLTFVCRNYCTPPSLAWCSRAWACQGQARCASLRMPAEPSPSVSRHPTDHCMPVFSITYVLTTSLLCQQPPTRPAALLAQHLRPSGILCCWPSVLALAAE